MSQERVSSQELSPGAPVYLRALPLKVALLQEPLLVQVVKVAVVKSGLGGDAALGVQHDQFLIISTQRRDGTSAYDPERLPVN